MIVENTTKRLLVIPASGAIQGALVRDRVALKPGFTKVNDDILAQVLGVDEEDSNGGNACVKSWFDIGMLKMCGEMAETPIPEKLEGVNARDSIDVIKRISSAEKLRGWLGDEERSTVRKAIENRIVELTGETP